MKTHPHDTIRKKRVSISRNGAPLLCIVSCFLFICVFFTGCKTNTQIDKELTDLDAIKQKGELVAVTLYSSTSYFEYRSEPMGYEYELVRDLADSLGVALQVVVAENTSRLLEMLEMGEADIIAYPIQMDNKLKQEFIYCGPETVNSQVLIQRAARGDTIIRNVTELIGREVHVAPHTKHYQRMVNLNNELGGGVIITELERDTLTTEDMIEMVSRGEIKYTIADEQVARMNKTYFWNIDIGMAVSFPQRSYWIVRQDMPLLAEAVDRWNEEKTKSGRLTSLIKRYFELSKRDLTDDPPIIRDGHVSPYDDLFRKHAQTLNWDWQLLASLAYQESHFNLNLVSWAGAQGLMGIMPNTARALGVAPHELAEPDIAIKTGVECLRRFRRGFTDISDPVEQTKFTLASYNAGIGHVYDAQRLAEKYGKNPHIWDNNVAEFIRLKGDPLYYNDPVCKHGYLRGRETFKYVVEVMERYDHYMRQTAK